MGDCGMMETPIRGTRFRSKQNEIFNLPLSNPFQCIAPRIPMKPDHHMSKTGHVRKFYLIGRSRVLV